MQLGVRDEESVSKQPIHFEALFVATINGVLRCADIADQHGSSFSCARVFLDVSESSAPYHGRILNATKLQKDELEALRTEIQRYINFKEIAISKRSATADRNEKLSLLRALSWFDTIRNRSDCTDLPIGDRAGDDHTSAFKMLRALELMMRALLRETYGDTTRIIERLRETLPSDYRDAVRRNPADPLSGLFLKDLIKLFVDESEWSRIEHCYATTNFLSLLRIKRETAEKFLEDIRRIRNSVAHLHSLSAVQVALLDYYYEELVQPVKESFAKGQTKVDPDGFESPKDVDIRNYCKAVLDEIRAETHTTKRWLSVSIGLSILLLISFGLVVLPNVRIMLDPDIVFIDAHKKSPKEHGSLAVQACEQQRPAELLDRLAELPHAATAFTGTDASRLNARIIAMAATDPRHLIPCIRTFQRMGWDPNQVGGNTVGGYFGSVKTDAAQPTGYQSYLAAYAAGFGQSPLASPTEIRCNVLMYAVWHGNRVLTDQLVAAGAKPHASCLLDGIALARKADVPVLDALTEARRMGNREIVKILEEAQEAK